MLRNKRYHSHIDFIEQSSLFKHFSCCWARSFWIKTRSIALIPSAKSTALYGLFSIGTWMNTVRELSMFRDVKYVNSHTYLKWVAQQNQFTSYQVSATVTHSQYIPTRILNSNHNIMEQCLKINLDTLILSCWSTWSYIQGPKNTALITITRCTLYSYTTESLANPHGHHHVVTQNT